jgi:hypothetical protein
MKAPLVHLFTIQIIRHAVGKQKTNDAPKAEPDTISIKPNSLANLNVLDNDSDPNGDEIYIKEVTDAQNGYVAVFDGKKELLYAADKGFEGVDCK